MVFTFRLSSFLFLFTRPNAGEITFVALQSVLNPIPNLVLIFRNQLDIHVFKIMY